MSGKLELFLLGGLSVTLDGEPLGATRTRKGLSLLALLALQRGRPRERQWIALQLWPDSDETTALSNLRRVLTDLRKVLGPAVERIESPTPSTLRLRVTRDELDLLRYEDAPPEDGVRLYTGGLLEGFQEEWALDERTRLEIDFRQKCRDVAHQLSRRGELAQASTLWRRLIALDQHDEEAYRELMEVLAASGNRAAALDLYRELHQHLSREQGTLPSPATVALYHRLRAAAQSPTPATPTAPTPPPRRHLPTPATVFIGREQELKEVLVLVGEERLVTLIGVGGIGKTRLALRIAERVTPFPAYFVDLSALSQPSRIPLAVAEALSVVEDQAHALQERITSQIGDQELLLVLDNCEHVLEGCQTLAEDLLQACPNVHLLTTSRIPLGLPEEVLWRVPPLSVPDPTSRVSPAALLLRDAARLFVERAMQVRADFVLTPTNLPAVARVCHLLDGIPLALELAAARLNVLTVEQLATRLEDRLETLVGGSAAARRQQTLRATLDWSWALLSEPERQLLQALSVFAGGFSLDALIAVCAALVGGENAAIQCLGQLVNASLVFNESAARGQNRFSLLETIRQYAQERLSESDQAAIQERHFAWCLDLARRARAAETTEHLATLEQERDNLRQALDYCAARGKVEQGLSLLTELTEFFHIRGHLVEGLQRYGHFFQLTRELAEPVPSALLAVALNAAGRLAITQGDLSQAEALFERCIAHCQAIGNRSYEAHATGNLGLVRMNQLELNAAHALFARAEQLHLQEGDRISAAAAQLNQGNIARALGRLDEARTALLASCQVKREERDLRGLVICLNILALVLRDLGEMDAAQTALAECLQIARELQYAEGIVNALVSIGLMCVRQGTYRQARRYYTEALEICQTSQLQYIEQIILVNLGDLAVLQGDRWEAVRYYSKALPGCEANQDWESVLCMLDGLGRAALLSQQRERGVTLLAAAAAWSQSSGFQLPPAAHQDTESALADVRVALGDAFERLWAHGMEMDQAAALAYLQESLERLG